MSVYFLSVDLSLFCGKLVKQRGSSEGLSIEELIMDSQAARASLRRKPFLSVP